MSRGKLRWLVVAACEFAALSQAVLAADDGTKPVAPPVQPAKVELSWMTDWTAARAVARDRKQLLFVYVAQDNPPAERCKWLEANVFADARAPEIAARCVLVRLRAGADITPEVRAFNLRYGVEAYPCLYVLNADGHLVVPGMDYSVDSILRAITFGEEEERDFARYSVGRTAEERKRHRESLEHRMAWEELLPLHEEDAKRRASPATFTTLANTYRRLGRASDERVRLAMAIELFEEDANRTRWRIRLATMSLDAVAGDAEKFHRGTIERLGPLAEQFGRERDRASEAEVRYAMGLAHAELHECPEAKQEFNSVVILAPGLATAPKALLGLAAVHWYEYDYANCRAACRRILEEYPRSPEAKPAARTIQSCDERDPPK